MWGTFFIFVEIDPTHIFEGFTFSPYTWRLVSLYPCYLKERELRNSYFFEIHWTLSSLPPTPTAWMVSSSHIFVAASHQTRLDTRSKARRPIKVGIKGRGRSGTSRDSNPACLCCSSAHLVQCEPDEASSFTNPNVGPGTYASLRLKLDAWSSAVQRGQKCSSPTRRLPSRSWGPIRPRVCSWFRAPIRHECQTAQLKSRASPCHYSDGWP